MSRRPGLILTAVLVAVGPTAGQAVPWEVAAADTALPGLLRVSGQGSVTTLLGPVPSHKVFTAAVNRTNDGLVTCLVHRTQGRFAVLNVDLSGVGTTLVAGSSPLHDVTAIDVDQRGDYLLLNNGPGSPTTGVYRLDAGNRLTTIAAATGFVNPLAMTEDLATGDLIVMDALGRFYRVTTAGIVTPLSTLVRPVSSLAALHPDPHGSGLFGAWGSGLFRVGLNPFSIATLALPPAPYRSMGLDLAPETGTLAVTSSPVLSSLNRVLHFDPTGVLLGTVAGHPNPLGGLAVIGSRNVLPAGAPRPGVPYTLTFSFPGEAAVPYLAAASFGHTPGFPAGGRTIPLNPDPLLNLSLVDPAMFAGFQGVLTAGGLGSGIIFVPNDPALHGLRFFVAALTYDAGGLRRVSEPLGVTLE